MSRDDIRQAAARNDRKHARDLFMALRHFLSEHQTCNRQMPDYLTPAGLRKGKTNASLYRGGKKPSLQLQLEWAQMARVAFLGMIKCCDPEQYTVLNIHIIAAAGLEPAHQFQCPAPGRPAAEALHIV